MSESSLKYNYVYQPYSPDDKTYGPNNIYAVSGPSVMDTTSVKLDGFPKANCYLMARRLNRINDLVQFESDYFKKQFNELFPDSNE